MVAEEARREAAVWSSRLLPFADLLPNTVEVEDLVLSVLSELSTDDFLTDVLAFCFPMASAGGQGHGMEGRGTVTNTKLRRIMTRLRSTAQCVAMDMRTTGSVTETDSPQLLSARYQLMSRAVLTNRSKVLGRDRPGSPHRDFLMVPEEGGVVIHEEDLNVGGVLLEYDMEYLCFLDIFLTMIFPHSVLGIQSMGPRTQQVPYVSEFGEGAEDDEISSDGPVACTLYPILNSLIKWAQTPYPQKTQETRHIKKKSGRRKMAKRRSKLDVCTMRVNLSIPVIIGCLREKEGAVSKDVSDVIGREVSGRAGSREVPESGDGPDGPGNGEIPGSGEILGDGGDVPDGTGSGEVPDGRVPGEAGSKGVENLPAQDEEQVLAKEKETQVSVPGERDVLALNTHQHSHVGHMHEERGSGSRTGGRELTETRGGKEVGRALRLLEVPEGVLQVNLTIRSHFCRARAGSRARARARGWG